MSELSFSEVVQGDAKIFRPYQQQLEALNSTARITAFVGGKGCGKTVILPIILYQWISDNPSPDARYYYVTPTEGHADRNNIMSLQEAFSGTDLEGHWIERRRSYELPTGGIIHFMSAEKPDSFEGTHVMGAVIDEGGRISYKAWLKLRTRCANHKAPILLATNPAMNWLFHEVYSNWKNGDPDYKVIMAKTTLNPSFPKEELERIKKGMPDYLFQQEYEGLFSKPAGLVFPELPECITDMLRPFPTGQWFGGVDFGNNFAAIAGVLDEDDCLWLCYERAKKSFSQSLTEQHIQKLKEFQDKIQETFGKSVLWFGDPASATEIKFFRRCGVNIRPAKKDSGSVDFGIRLCQIRMHAHKLKILRGNVINLLLEAEGYAFVEQEDMQFSDSVTKRHDHCLDAMRLLIYMLDRKKDLFAK